MIIVRPYKPADYAQVRNILIEAELFDEIWDSQKNLDGLSKQTPASLFVGEIDGNVVAQIYVIRFGSQVAQLYRLAVKKAYQKQGIATQLLQEVEQELKKQDVVEVGLFVDAKKLELNEFYMKRGYGSNQGTWVYQWKKL